MSQVASSSPIIQPSVEYINESVAHLVDTHPVLVLQWCQVLRQLKYMDSHFWCGFLDTGSRLSTGKKNASSIQWVLICGIWMQVLLLQSNPNQSNPFQSNLTQSKPNQPTQPNVSRHLCCSFRWWCFTGRSNNEQRCILHGSATDLLWSSHNTAHGMYLCSLPIELSCVVPHDYKTCC